MYTAEQCVRMLFRAALLDRFAQIFLLIGACWTDPSSFFMRFSFGTGVACQGDPLAVIYGFMNFGAGACQAWLL